MKIYLTTHDPYSPPVCTLLDWNTDREVVVSFYHQSRCDRNRRIALIIANIAQMCLTTIFIPDDYRILRSASVSIGALPLPYTFTRLFLANLHMKNFKKTLDAMRRGEFGLQSLYYTLPVEDALLPHPIDVFDPMVKSKMPMRLTASIAEVDQALLQLQRQKHNLIELQYFLLWLLFGVPAFTLLNLTSEDDLSYAIRFGCFTAEVALACMSTGLIIVGISSVIPCFMIDPKLENLRRQLFNFLSQKTFYITMPGEELPDLAIARSLKLDVAQSQLATRANCAHSF